MSDAWTKTTCPYCGVGCGILADATVEGTINIKGDPDHPANRGRLCSKGAALGETMSLEGRLLYPEIAGRRTSWDEALDTVAARFAQTIAEHGPDAVAFYVSGQILTEDYYVANKLMKGFIGSANIDTNSRLCMASSVAGHKRAFGTDTVPGSYEDLEHADLVVLVGSNLAWCHPVLYQRLAEARTKRGTRVVVIDPRETATCDIADLHLDLTPGSDVALFNGLLAHLSACGHIDEDYVARHTSGLRDALSAAGACDLFDIARITGLPTARINAFYEIFAATERVVTVYSQGVNQSSAGTDKVNAIINCHLVTARIGQPGMGPFSVTGQPNAMGGRETGGLANMLAAHMELGEPAHRQLVQTYWASPTLAEKPGLKAVDLFRAIGDGRVKAVWIMATNPVVSLPQADAVRDALAGCPFVVVSDVVRETDTTALAHVLLPSSAWGEKDGTVTNSERRISRQRRFLPSPADVKSDWWQMAEVAKRMGFGEAFAWQHPSEIFAEYARLTGLENGGTRDLDISAHATITAADYDALQPFQWPQPAGSTSRETRFFADGGFFTSDRKARLVATRYRPPVQQADAAHPFVLNTGRLRDQWHTMTRTAKAPRLMAHAPEPVLEVHPQDADRAGLVDADLAIVESIHGSAILRVSVTTSQRPGHVFAPMHWTSGFASRARIDAVVGSATDPVSGQPELKHTGVSVAPYAASWHGFAVTRAKPPRARAPYLAVAPVPQGFRCEMAGDVTPQAWSDVITSLICSDCEAIELLSYHDEAAGQHRFAAFADGRLACLLFIGPRPLTLARDWAADQIGRTVPPDERLRLLAGRPGANLPDRGPLVCACLGVGRNEIIGAVTNLGAATVEEVGAYTNGGTNCGSCRAEIGRIIQTARLEQAV